MQAGRVRPQSAPLQHLGSSGGAAALLSKQRASEGGGSSWPNTFSWRHHGLGSSGGAASNSKACFPPLCDKRPRVPVWLAAYICVFRVVSLWRASCFARLRFERLPSWSGWRGEVAVREEEGEGGRGAHTRGYRSNVRVSDSLSDAVAVDTHSRSDLQDR